MGQHVARPAVFDGFANVPKSFAMILNLLKDKDVMAPRNLSHKLCDKFFLTGVKGVKPHHPVKVSAGKAFHVLEFSAQILGNLFDHSIPPTARLLPLGNLLADVPIQGDKLGVDGHRRLDLHGLNTVFQVGNQAPVFARFDNILAHGFSL